MCIKHDYNSKNIIILSEFNGQGMNPLKLTMKLYVFLSHHHNKANNCQTLTAFNPDDNITTLDGTYLLMPCTCVL